MSELAIDIDRVSRMFKRYRHPRYQVLEALGWRAPRKGFDEFWALRDISIRMRRGDRVGIIGRNGAGKSTLLSIVCGRLQPTSGAARVNGRIQALMELGTGFHPEFTGRENVLTSLAYQGITGRKAQALLDEVFDFAELDDFIDQPVKTYSTGMYARLAFTTSTVLKPDVLIIDEVLGAGDAYFAAKSTERMRQLTVETGATVLFVSHDISAVQRLCERAVWIDRGQIKMEGSTLEVSKRYYATILEQEEERLRARTSQVVSRLRRTGAETGNGAESELYLLRFATLDGQPPQQKHPIRRIAIVLADGRSFEVCPGGAMDNDAEQTAYLVTDPEESLWSVPVELDGRIVRRFENTGGRYPQATMVFRLPPESLARPAQILVEHTVQAGERVALDIRIGDAYRSIGLLEPAPNGWSSQQFSLDLSRFRSSEPSERIERELRILRLVDASGLSPRFAHPIRRIAVVLADGCKFEVCPGNGVDVDPREPAYLVADPEEVMWGEPVEVDGNTVRCFENTGGKYAQAPAFFQLPIAALVGGARLVVEHATRLGEEVAVEILEGENYRRLGVLTAGDVGWFVEEFTFEPHEPENGELRIDPDKAEPKSAAELSAVSVELTLRPDRQFLPLASLADASSPEKKATPCPPATRDQWETEEARFVEIYPCTAESLVRKHSFRLGEDIAFRIVAEITVELPPFWVVAVMHDGLGNRVALLADQLTSATAPGTYEFVIHLPRPNLRQGEYVLTFELLPELDLNWTGEVRLPYLCHWDRCVFFNIDEQYRGTVELGRVQLPMELSRRRLMSTDHERVLAL